MPTEVNPNSSSRKLAAILFADVVGYTSLMQKDERKASTLLKRFQDELSAKVDTHNGRIVNFYGDGALCTFDNPLDAMRCAISVQSGFQTEPKVPVRVGIHSGTVVSEGDKVYGDSVNVASRIESMGIPGAILVSKKVRDELKNQPDILLPSLGSFEFKNVEEPMEIFALANEGFAVPKKGEIKGKLKTSGSIFSSKVMAFLLAIVIVSIAGLAYNWYKHSANSDLSVSNLNAITIFPFDVKGSTDIQYLGEGIVDLLSTKLDGIPNVNPIDPNRIFNEIDPDNNPNRDLEEATDISEDLGATKFVLGSIIELNEDIQITASQYDIEGVLISKKSVTGSKTALISLIDDLVKSLLTSETLVEGLEIKDLAVMTSESVPALKSFLNGEQSFRRGSYSEAFGHYKEATEIDSTYAMAYLRLRDASSWLPALSAPRALEMASKYSHKLPEKWQDLIKAIRLYIQGKPETERYYKSLIAKYGETREFTYGLAEYYFHFNPVHGRSYVEAKPWFIKAKELDPKNSEVNLHLADIALAERDSAMADKLLSETDESFELYGKYKSLSMFLQNDTSEVEIRKLTSRPEFKEWFLDLYLSVPEDADEYLSFLTHFSKTYRTEKQHELWLSSNGSLYGKEKLSYESYKETLVTRHDESWITGFTQIEQCLAASMMSGNDFNPRSEYYLELLEGLKNEDYPWAVFASIKYSMALGLDTEVDELKLKLKELINTDNSIGTAKYFDFSLQAFEAKQNGDFDQCLVLIDSAFQYSPGFWQSQSACMDKIFMQADIYESRGELEKSIAYLENIPVADAYINSKGYATYRLTGLYEKVGNTDKALAKCNLLIKDYVDCDEKYKPWVVEAKSRRDRLMANLL